jgi:hypothetical protein
VYSEKESERLIAIWMCGNLNGVSFAFEINHCRHAKFFSFNFGSAFIGGSGGMFEAFLNSRRQ